MRFRKDLGRSGLIKAVAGCFGRIDDPVNGRRFHLGDHLMSAFAMFSPGIRRSCSPAGTAATTRLSAGTSGRCSGSRRRPALRPTPHYRAASGHNSLRTPSAGSQVTSVLWPPSDTTPSSPSRSP